MATEVKAQLKYLRIAPRKVRSVADLIRNKNPREAETQLRFMPRRASAPILKLLKSAISNAKNNFNIEKENLFIKEIRVNEGVPYKRWRPMSRGRAFPIMKRTSHIILVLGVKEGAKIQKKKSVKIEEKNQTPSEVKPETFDEKQKRAPREIKKTAGVKGFTKKIFRRKAV
jgi:large subunit ribosomal protein L22